MVYLASHSRRVTVRHKGDRYGYCTECNSDILYSKEEGGGGGGYR